jgi:hypothetical protein
MRLSSAASDDASMIAARVADKEDNAEHGWQRKFEDPIPLPVGRALVTLRDAADYITSLPKKESDLPEWQTAIEVLMLVSRGGPTMMARIGVMKALNRPVAASCCQCLVPPGRRCFSSSRECFCMSANQRISLGDVQSMDESGCPGLMLASKSVSSRNSRVSSTVNPIRIRFPSSSKA